MPEKDEKKHDASTQKLERLRKEGRLPDSPELLSSIALLFLVLALLFFSDEMAESVSRILRDAFQFFSNPLDKGLSSDFFEAFMVIALILLAPIFVTLFAALRMKGLNFQFDNIHFKFSKLNLVQNFSQKFGAKGLGQFLVSFSKAVAVGCLGLYFGRVSFRSAYKSLQDCLALQIISGVHVMNSVLVVMAICFLVFGGLDYVLKRNSFLKENMMTDREVKDEHKDNEGSPEIKQKRRQKAYEISSSRMMQDAGTADVLIVNPIHVAVALRWSREKGTAPVCVAKGQDLVALRIKEIAMENGIPIHEDIPTARTLNSVCGVGEEVPPDLYAAVAIAIRFADSLREKARKSPFGAV
ncbi:EscU/YscU/HrcU family type III secretion system export apparatus switch protein [Donghicola sp. C2-DW-16]|uniref:EscU/YscU/HrcU family type III secretion system export apparatus switch protein n=1 Tax=Donghicola mangrovi TaxID=2729614 RepID=A0ABX2PAC7_9RHOB|nr:EscU/YscU/HrcU family type III secretion system export apparatus switch protein [Donghicola mangrovi]NVO25972.1 EscU/YscU/HrcU family type III secretion system export apparatus switch protein [Donghicola mangrovi]